MPNDAATNLFIIQLCAIRVVGHNAFGVCLFHSILFFTVCLRCEMEEEEE